MKEFEDSVKAAAAAFKEVGWEWDLKDAYVPDGDQIRATFLRCLRELVQSQTTETSSGRLTVKLDASEPSIEFSLELGTVYGQDVFKLLATGA